MSVDPAVMFGTGLGLKAFALYLCFVGAAAASLVWRSEIGLYLLAVTLPLQTTRYHLHGFPLGPNLVDVVLLCVFAGTVLRPEEAVPRSRRMLLFLFGMGVFYYVSLWRGSSFLGTPPPIGLDDQRLIDFKNVMVMPVLAWATMRAVRTRRQMMVLVACMAVSLLLVNVSYLRTEAGRDFSHYLEAVRDSGPLGYAGENGLAAYLVGSVAMLIPFLGLRSSLTLKCALAGLIGLSTYCLLFTYSREAYLALLLVLVFLAVLRMRWLLLPLALLAATWSWVLPQAVQERISMTYTSPDQGESAQLDHSAQERVDLLHDALNLVAEEPVYGTGFMTYAQMGRVGTFRDTHDYYLKMLVETGFPGLLLFLAELALFFLEGWRVFRRAGDRALSSLGLGFCAAVLSFSVVNLFGDRWQYIQVTSSLWIGLGCVIAASALCEDVPESEASRARPPRALERAALSLAGGLQ